MTDLTTLFKLLSDETRLRILILLYLDQLCVCQLSGIIAAPQPRISKNLAKLRDMNLVKDERQEKYVYYRLKNNDALLINNLKYIIEHKELYPSVFSDIEKLPNKCCYSESLENEKN
jgi:ArsR family transcriptional regulator